MTSNTVSNLLDELGVAKSLNRPYVSNDNPYSESHFKTMKYQPTFPERFGSIQDARKLCIEFVEWYNNEHRHSGIALMTPENVHYGRATKLNKKRQELLTKAFNLHPERFVNGSPKALKLPKEVWINPPEKVTKESEIAITVFSTTEVQSVR